MSGGVREDWGFVCLLGLITDCGGGLWNGVIEWVWERVLCEGSERMRFEIFFVESFIWELMVDGGVSLRSCL